MKFIVSGVAMAVALSGCGSMKPAAEAAADCAKPEVSVMVIGGQIDLDYPLVHVCKQNVQITWTIAQGMWQFGKDSIVVDKDYENEFPNCNEKSQDNEI